MSSTTKLRCLVLVGLTGLFLTACGGSTITHGKVTAKQDIPAHDWTYMDPIPHQTCIEIGSTNDCNTYFTYIPIDEHDNEEWTVTFGTWVKGKFVKRTVDVSQSQYGHIKIHSQYRLPNKKGSQ